METQYCENVGGQKEEAILKLMRMTNGTTGRGNIYSREVALYQG